MTPRPTPFLARGDTIGVVSPGFAVKRTLLDSGVKRLRRMGYRVVLGEHVLARHGYLAGDDDARASDLDLMLRDPAVRAVWFARGGYGTARILDRVPWRSLRNRPRLLIGYSDLTALFAGVQRKTGSICLYAPVVTELGDSSLYHRPSLIAGLAGEPLSLRVSKRQVLAPGKATGRLIGGNLSVFTRLCGTRYLPSCDGAILFVEEVGEQTYRIDGMLRQLALAGCLERLAGVLIGALSVPTRRRFPPDLPLDDLLGEVFLPLGVPVVRGLPVGHLQGKRTLPLGARTVIDTVAGRVRFEP